MASPKSSGPHDPCSMGKDIDIGWEAKVGALLERLTACEAVLDTAQAVVDEYAEAVRQLKATGQLPGDLLRRQEEYTQW